MSKPSDIDPDKFYEYSVARLEKELDTSRARLTRMLYVNGFLISALAVIDKLGVDHPISVAIAIACPLAGFVVSLASYFSLKASHAQRDRIKTFWTEKGRPGDYPPFFAPGRSSAPARIAATALPVTLCLIWAALLAFVGASVIPFEMGDVE